MSTLDRIAKSHGTDKSSEIHNYCIKYEKYLPFKRFDKINILEIGVLDGKSLSMWSDYFYNSKVIGIDINSDCKKYENDHIKVEIGSQIDLNFLDTINQKYGQFDLIIDDGSHINSDVIMSFTHLFNHLKSGGVYIIEDSCTSYWNQYDGGYLKTNTSVEYFKRLIDDVNFRGIENHDNKDKIWHRSEEFLIPLSKKYQPLCRTDIESINFLNSLILITKR